MYSQVCNGHWDELWSSVLLEFLKPPNQFRGRLFFVLRRNPAFKIQIDAGGKRGPVMFCVLGLAECKSGIWVSGTKETGEKRNKG